MPHYGKTRYNKKMKPSHKWAPLSDCDDWRSLAREELSFLSNVWKEQKEEIESSGALLEFEQKLRRAWAVETGLIERAYMFDRGITTTLIEFGIDESVIPRGPGQSPQKTAAMIRDHKAVIDGLFDFVASKRDLSTSYIKEIHAALLRNQETTSGRDQLGNDREIPLLKGDYKKSPNNPEREGESIHEYCPPEHTAAEMDKLIELHEKHIEEEVAPEVEAAWLHHRFSQIHPFQDGNGRVARCLATLIFLRADWFPLIVSDTEREKYITALETADRGDLQPLTDFFALCQRKAFVEAIGISREAAQDASIGNIIASAAQKLAKRQERQQISREKTKKLAAQLQKIADERMAAVCKQLADKIPNPLSGKRDRDSFYVDSHHNGDEPDRGYFFRAQIIDTAKKLGYFANPNAYRAWSRLALLPPGGRAEILLSFHGIGHEYRGVIACSACIFRREETEENERQVSEPEPLAGEFFQINYFETEKGAKRRFEKWIDKALAEGLALWSQSI